VQPIFGGYLFKINKGAFQNILIKLEGKVLFRGFRDFKKQSTYRNTSASALF